jgi:hypothetical protein
MRAESSPLRRRGKRVKCLRHMLAKLERRIAHLSQYASTPPAVIQTMQAEAKALEFALAFIGAHAEEATA